jgi:putative energy coupling factor transporter S component
MSESGIKTRDMVLTALFAALIFVVTWTIRIPLPFSSAGGYLNVGDVIIVVCAYLLGGPKGAMAAAIGSGFADLAAGAAIYIPATFVIKGLMGYVSGVILKKHNFVSYIIAAIVNGAIMVAGYALFEWIFFDRFYAMTALPFNCIQWAGCSIIAIAIYPVSKRIDVLVKR